jgi:hypothetical protein
MLNKDLDTLRHMTIYQVSGLYRILGVRMNSKRIWLFRSGERDPI